MEESTEGHMEAVSSTTEDVPETLEVTGTHGNVEMVIVVENMSEDSQPDNVSPQTVSSPEEAPLMEVEPQVEDSTFDKDTEQSQPTQDSPEKPEQSLNTAISDSQLENIAGPSNAILQMESADSSSKPDEGKPIDKESLDISMKEPEVEKKEEAKNIDISLVESEASKPTEKSANVVIELKDVIDKNSPVNEIISENLNGNIVSITNDKQNESSVNVTSTTLQNAAEPEASNDSQAISEPTEKEHNKSISRELKSLIKSAKESKIISECNQLTSKTRKSRTLLDTSLNSSVDADKILARRNSNNSQKSNCSEMSDRASVKRSMRSQNPEFASKVKLFLNSVTSKVQKDSDVSEDDDDSKGREKEKKDTSLRASTPKKRKLVEDPSPPEKSNKLRTDPYCWRCHWAVEQTANEKAHPPMQCTVCPRSFHFKCLTGTERSKIVPEKKNWVCPECLIVLHAESSETRSHAMKKISLGTLCELLTHALERMMDLNGVEPFIGPVDRSTFSDYDKYVVHPMDLALMKTNIESGLYGSTEAFVADAQWILHNSIIFNTLQSKLTAGARALVRSCRGEMGEIEACPECYAAAHARRPTWFTDVCSTPHILLWAKLKGFPYWPAKGMSVGSAGMVDVRFFGAHDRAWVPAKDCFLFSEKDPNNFRTKRQDLLDSMQEAEQHIRNISRKYEKFVYPPYKVPFDPSKLGEQLKLMIPAFEGEVRTPVKDKAMPSPKAAKEKSRSNSKSSKGSGNDGDVGDLEETPTRKSSDGAEMVQDERENNAVSVKADDTQNQEIKDKNSKKNNEAAPRKRRRSDLEEAVITILEPGPAEKKRRIDDAKKVNQPRSSKEDKQNKSQLEFVDVNDINKADGTEPTLKDCDSTSSSAENHPRVMPIRISLSTRTNKPQVTTVKTNTTPKTTPKVNTSTPKDNSNSPKVAIPAKPSTPKGNFSLIKVNDSSPKTNSPQSKFQAIAPKPSTIKVTSPKGAALKLPVTPNNKVIPQKQKAMKMDKSAINEKQVKTDKIKRRIRVSRSNIATSNSFNNTDTSANNSTSKDKNDNTNASKSKNNEADKNGAKTNTTVGNAPKSEDNASLAHIARGSNNTLVSSSPSGLPTISCVRSLSATVQTTALTATSSSTTQVTAEANSDSSVFTPTSTDNVRTAKDATNKLQTLRFVPDPLVGRVGVRAFARMTSPPSEKQNVKDTVQVEIKSEPIDLDDAERHSEKMDLMKAFRLRPVNPQPMKVNKVVVTPLNARKPVTKTVEIRPRAKKSFPQPKKVDEGRSELISKNSMVYIPIQPPATQAPVRPQTAVRPTAPAIRFSAPSVSTATNSLVNTVTTPIMPTSIMSTLSSPTSSSSTPPSSSSMPTIGQVPTVHTVPLVTSVNGQLMFSLHPVMSLGGIDSAPSPPMVNGVTDRSSGSSIMPVVPQSQGTPTSNPPTMTQTPIACRTPNDTPSAPGEPPRLQQRPALLHPLDSNTPISTVPPPSTAGPLTAKFNQNASKLTEFFRTLLEESLEKVEEPTALVTSLQLQIEQLRWRHRQQAEELKHNHELIQAEMRASFEKEKSRAVSEARRAAQVELEAAVAQAKTKQWCANCSQESQFYCCWNTSYCDYPCQRAHWPLHAPLCTQHRQDGDNGDSDNSSPPERLQPQPDNLPKQGAPAGGRLAPSLVYTHDQPNTHQKTSIILSMVENSGGSQSLKCVGTYKPPDSQQPPLIINKQIMSNEENAGKKVVTSGGYLIVGASAASNSVVTPSRRTHTIQYIP